MSSAQAVFIVLAAAAVAGALGVVFFRSPVRAAISLVLNFFVLGFLYFTLGAQLLGITQIMVYAGAIMVLFLFVVMLLNLQGQGDERRRTDLKPWLGGMFGLALFGLTAWAVIGPMQAAGVGRVPDSYGTAESIGHVLFTVYAWPFEVASVLLLIGIVGSILLAKRRI